ncbi:hypothetical protein [Nesterenkonia suensis]
MTTPAPEKTTRRRRPRRQSPARRPRLRLGVAGWVVSWLLPTAVMGGLLLGLSFVPGLDEEGFLTPLIPLIGGAAVAVGIPGTLLVTWLYRHHLNPTLHVLGYVVVGLLYGPIVLLAGTGGLMPMLIPLVGFPAGVLLGIGRWAAQPLATVTDPAAGDREGRDEEGRDEEGRDEEGRDDD